MLKLIMIKKYKGYKIEFHNNLVSLKIIGGEGGWCIDVSDVETNIIKYIENHIDNVFLKADQKAGRI